MLNVLFVAVCVGVAALLLNLTRSRRLSSGLKPLPGPRGIPFAGVPHKLAPVLSTPWIQFTAWAEEYGPIYQASVMGEQLVIISSNEVHDKLLMKRRARFGGRPHLPSMPWIDNAMVYPPLIRNLAKAKHARKIGVHLLSSIPRPQLAAACARSAKDFIYALQRDPSNVQSLCELAASRITCELFYANPSSAAQNCYASGTLLNPVSPGNLIAAKLPFLTTLWDILPTSFQPWKATEVARRAEERAFWVSQLERGLAASAAGTWTVAGELDRLQKSEKSKSFQYPSEAFADSEGDSADLLGMLTVIGSLLLSTTLQMFIIAMCQHPEWQIKGAYELYSVCPGRLPTPADLPELPILRALIREVHRWRPAVPLGAPHVNPEAEEYDGYEIPAGATVLSLVWTKERDPVMYPNAEEFRPERWLESGWPSYKEPLSEWPKMKGIPGFGWGERACIGQEYVEWFNVMLIGAVLMTTTVGKKKDEVTGKEIEISDMNFKDATIFIKPKAWEMKAEKRGEEAMKCLED